MKARTKLTLINMKIAINNALVECKELPCECDSYNGFTCPIHGWKRTLEQLIKQLDDAISEF